MLAYPKTVTKKKKKKDVPRLSAMNAVQECLLSFRNAIAVIRS